MIKVSYVRILARLWFGSMLLLAISICVMSFNAQAAGDEKLPPTQTEFEGKPPRGGRPGDLDLKETKPNTAPDFIEMNEVVRQKVEKNNGPYILGRQEEIADLAQKLKQSDSHTVLVQAEGGGGGMGVIEEYIRNHPDDKFYRLNMAKIGELDAIQASKSVQNALLTIERRNNESGKLRKHILVVENLSGLLKGEFAPTQPIQDLRQSIARTANVYSLILTDEATANNQLLDGRYSGLRKKVEVINVKSPAYDMVVSYLIRSKASLEQSGVRISLGAIENAARIAVRFRATDAFKFAYQLLASSADTIKENVRTGSTIAERVSSDINQLGKMRDVILAELKVETNPEEKAALESRLAQTEKKIAESTLDLTRLSESKDLSQPKRANELELEITLLERELLAAREKAPTKGWLGGIFGSNDQAQSRRPVGVIDQELKNKNKELAELTLNELSTDGNSRESFGKVGVSDVIRTAAKRLNVKNPSRLTANFNDGIQRIPEIKNSVFGQNDAINALQGALQVEANKLQEGPVFDPAQYDAVMRGEIPAGKGPPSAMLVGPTGTGKTLTAERLADVIGYELLVYDMSEFNQSHTIARLIGAPPGYKGMEEPGQLLKDVDANPESVVLFDEIEKAHPEVHKILLQILDKGRASAANGGKKTDFRRTVVLMTSNLFQEIGTMKSKELVMALQGEGMTPVDIEKETALSEYKMRTLLWTKKASKVMPPELVQRVKHILTYNPITPEIGVMIAEKSLKQFTSRLNMRGVNVKYTPGALVELMSQFNTDGGGRDVERKVMDLFRMPAAKFLAENNLVGGDTLLIHYNEQRQLEMIHTTETELAAADRNAGAKVNANPELADVKEKMVRQPRTKAAQSLQAARAATASLIEKTFKKDWFVSENTYRFLKRGK